MERLDLSVSNKANSSIEELLTKGLSSYEFMPTRIDSISSYRYVKSIDYVGGLILLTYNYTINKCNIIPHCTRSV